MSVLVARGVQKAFGPNVVLRGVDFALAAGEVHALLGENGAGKSTFMRILLGLEAADAGDLTLGGAPYRPADAAAARRAGVVMVPQERTLCPHLTVTENLVLGVEPARFGFVSARSSRTIAERALAMVFGGDRRIDPDVRAGSLSVAEQQLVEIARAIAHASARVLILDEPTSSLGKDDSDRLFERIHALKEGGLGIVLVTHFLGDVRVHADRYTVLRDGVVRGHGDARTTESATIVHEMMGKALEQTLRKTAARAQSGDVLLEARELAGAHKPARVSFTLRRGEIVGIAGLVGAGRTELLRMLAGIDTPKSGTVVVDAPRGVGLLSEDRAGEGLMLGRAIADNVTLSPRGDLVARPAKLAGEGERFMRELAIRAVSAAQAVGELSGGNQQKVQIARMLREDFDVLLIDEPTRGIDVASKAQVLALLRDLAQRGKGIVLVSSQLDELVGTCDRIAVLRRGTLGPFRDAHAWTEEALMLEAAS